MARKFIISSDRFIMGNVLIHLDLIPRKPKYIDSPFCENIRDDEFKCIGGGRWHADNEKKVLYLWGASTDFGYAEPEKIKAAISSPETWISGSMTGWPIKHSPVISDELPELDTFVDIMEVPE